ncbi:olfactory receptor 2AP1-like [Spea bombifrons]|uniref:olfactory receptor 2AP1-like n=1 Tax=Spea bombifrons TaxID=233779 RepID=UPI0023494E3A|nr:olfactory receptor 2AP1-like [Spea bombifrons]
MNQANETNFIYFVIEGISDLPELQVPIFLLVLLIYLITLGGNLTILLLICLDRRLRTPMYFFLGNLSVLDMSSTVVTLHKVLLIAITGDKSVSYVACVAQLYIFASLIGDELLLLAAMSYDRYLAICRPLHYHKVMNQRLCCVLAITSWLLGCLENIPLVVLLSMLTCFRSKQINHYYCDILPLKEISCSDTSALDLLIFVSGTFHTSVSFFLTFIPYIFIISCILRISSRVGRRKAFYTCSSHLAVVVLLYVTLVFQYLRSNAAERLDTNKLFNTAAVPMLNPLIYSLKNKDVKSSLRHRIKMCGSIKCLKICSSQKIRAMGNSLL